MGSDGGQRRGWRERGEMEGRVESVMRRGLGSDEGRVAGKRGI